VLDLTPGGRRWTEIRTLRVEGENAFGFLSTESGVHRLIRISPFDQAARRQRRSPRSSSFLKFDDRIDIVVKTEEVRIDTFRAAAAAARTFNKWKPRSHHAPSERHRRAMPE